MKYLKSFKESVDNNIIQDVKEILLEFSDSGNDIKVDWVDSRYKDEIVVIIKNNTQELDVDTFIRLFSYMKGLDFKCNYINCGYPVNEKQFDASDKIYISQQDKDFNFYSDSTTKEGIDQVNSWKALELVFHKMKSEKISENFITESFAMSSQLSSFFKENSLPWNEFTDSLYDLQNEKDITINKHIELIDQNNHTINVELEDDKEYRIKYHIGISYYTPMKGQLKNFIKSEEVLSTISISLQEMIDRVSEKLKLLESTYKVEQVSHRTNYGEIQYSFQVEFLSGVIDKTNLQRYYKEYLSQNKFTPEFNQGIKKLVEIYKEERIEFSRFLDTTPSDDYILVGFVTEDELFGVADYNTKTKVFSIDKGEVENSIEWYRETYGFE